MSLNGFVISAVVGCMKLDVDVFVILIFLLLHYYTLVDYLPESICPVRVRWTRSKRMLFSYLSILSLHNNLNL